MRANARSDARKGCDVEVKRIRQVYIVAEDVEAAARFYTGTLGLAEQFRDGANWVQLSAGDISLAIASASEGQGAAVGQPVPVFEVDDLEAALAAVSAGGGSAGDVRDMGDHGRTALATDPSGASISFFQR